MTSTELDELVAVVSEVLASETDGGTEVPRYVRSEAGAGRGFRPGLKARIMEAISKPANFSVTASQGQWVETPIAGIMMKLLSLDRARDSAVMLLKAEAGARYPAHHHSKAEECYVISGEVLIHGQLLKAGDFHHAEPDSDHEELYTPTGVEVLLVVSASDYGL